MNQSTAVDQSSNDVLLFSTRKTFRLTLFACDVTRHTVLPLSLCQMLCDSRPADTSQLAILPSGRLAICVYVAIVGSSLFLDHMFFLLGIRKAIIFGEHSTKMYEIGINQIRIEPIKPLAMSRFYWLNTRSTEFIHKWSDFEISVRYRINFDSFFFQLANQSFFPLSIFFAIYKC